MSEAKRRYPVTFLPQRLSVEVEPGKTLMEAARAGGIDIPSYCGGKGKCNKCLVKVAYPKDPERFMEVKSCQVPVFGPTTVEVEPRHMRISGPARVTKKAEISREGPLGLAVDLGTTSIIVGLMEMAAGESLAEVYQINEQQAYGADVMTRLNFIQEQEDGLEVLSRSAREQIGKLMAKLLSECGVAPERVTTVAIAGNPAMEHILLKLPTHTLAQAPFEPFAYKAVRSCAGAIGFPLPEVTPVVVMPCLGGFVGGDAFSVIAATEMMKKSQLVLALDIGTNCEILLGNKDEITMTSTPAGPAFEGTNISCGMRAMPGAITKVDAVDSSLACEVWGGGKALGLCGTGLLDAIAAGLSLGVINHHGIIQKKRGLSEEDHIPLSPGDDGVNLFQEDIRNLQLAKSALRTGVEILMDRRGVKPEDIREVYVVGAFGANLRPESLYAIGALPEFSVPIQTFGGENAVIIGLGKLLKDGLEKTAAEVERKKRHIPLPDAEDFQDRFIHHIDFHGVSNGRDGRKR